ncbi:probable Replication factor C subunit 2 [Saccharomycodes ludwigii]|uniref:Replication factor C subunit 2 n=1 Tax=Saccharomycodes ludwigii TaxID=36035 RepID=A0A376BAW4_9ASCO|nr:hypothetical protein SCDLUD_000418 [Saccharomycodes ludwigii]KAH3902826.1 hypothetical protein SCDLUD_000418 [Saccharomycodes ludwigii]SSD61694.1 probable Replication factor C subunit 2 [Saccharomycodes ludwigii]
MTDFPNKKTKLSPSTTLGIQDNSNKPWVEKYRPSNLDEVTAQEHAIAVLKTSLKSANLPHMLFYGPPGTGKTSTILALTKELFGPKLIKSRVLELNASDERGISIVREKVKNFASLTVSKPTNDDLAKYACPPYKIIILDEADSMTSDAQSALRRTMETYSSVTRFCLICNYVTRIIDPLASRCTKFRFKPLNETNALDRLTYISTKELLHFENDDMNGICFQILKICDGDLRKAITLLQSSSKMTSNGTGEITSAQINELAGVIPDNYLEKLIESISSKNVQYIITFVNDFIRQGWSVSAVVSQLYDYYTKAEESDNLQSKVDWLLFDTDSKLTNGTNEHIQLLNLSLQLSQLY